VLFRITYRSRLCGKATEKKILNLYGIDKKQDFASWVLNKIKDHHQIIARCELEVKLAGEGGIFLHTIKT